jgi:hypothetical protein
MKTSPALASSSCAPNPRLTSAHQEIATQAESLWRGKGCPPERDAEIWLEAESQIGIKHRLAQSDRDEKAFADPHFLFHQGGGIVMDQLNELFPGSTGRETTSL